MLTHLYTLQIRAVPYLNCVISQARDNFVIIILQTIDTFRVFRATINPSKHMSSGSPVIFDGINVLFEKEVIFINNICELYCDNNYIHDLRKQFTMV